MKGKILRISVIIFTVIFVIILLQQIQMNDIVKTLESIGIQYILVGFGLYLLSYFFRTLRFYILLNRKVGLTKLFNIICIHNMVNNIMPMRTGELSYIYLLKKNHNKTVGEGLATLLMARVFDIIGVSTFFIISALIMPDLPELIMKMIWIVVFFMIVIIVFLISLLYFGENSLSLIKKFFQRFNYDKKYIVDYLLRKGEETVGCFRNIRSKKDIFLIFLLSLLIFALNYSLIYILLIGMKIHLSFQIVVLGATFTLLASVLPIYSIGGFGTTEGIWTLVFVSLGLTLETAIVSGFSYHIIIWAYFLILGSYGSLGLYFFRKGEN